ncbi:class A beta-lactamase, partial [Aeromicrobium sp. IC_218]|uniref:class A beta-lactamase n=1 Tax=Aeromicrobium sp. IC_218 TaxID=2545468 RepID=UPI00103E59AF
SPSAPSPSAIAPADVTPTDALRGLERRHDARLGLVAVDTGSGAVVAHRADERFAHASTSKLLLAAAVLERRGVDGMQERVRVPTATVPHSPATQSRAGGTMTWSEVLDAALRLSDNTAANLLAEDVGGPSGVTGVLRGWGDDVTRVDRLEPDLNTAEPGDERDTSTPRALAEHVRALVLGDRLPTDARDRLVDRMRASTTGADLVRAGVPDGWTVADRSGGAAYGSRHDLAVVWPPEGAPIVLAVMTSRDAEDAQGRDALVAEATRTAVDALAGR